MTKAYLIVGNVGAGKSTYAAKLAIETDAEIFTNDDWLTKSFATPE